MNPIELNESCISGACQNSLKLPHQGGMGIGQEPKSTNPSRVKPTSGGLMLASGDVRAKSDRIVVR